MYPLLVTLDLAEPGFLVGVLFSLILVYLESCETFMCFVGNPTEGSVWRLFHGSAFLGISSNANQAQSERVALLMGGTRWWAVQIRKIKGCVGIVF